MKTILILAMSMLLMGLSACAPASTTPAAPSTAASPGTSAASAGALASIIEGAKKEGRVFATMKAELAGKGIEHLEQEIRNRYNVDLKIEFQPTGGYPTDLAKALAEFKAGVTPTLDIMTFSTPIMPDVMASGAFEKVDYKPLLAPGTPPEAVQFDGYGLAEYTGHIGLMYNSKAVSASEAPKTLRDLADPKWRGKIAIFNYPGSWLNLAFARGVDKTLDDLKAILKNEPVVGRYADGFTRYMAGEIPIIQTSSVYYIEAKEKGVASEWVSADVSWPSVHQLVLRKGAQHPNAAKLLALTVSSPKGAEIVLADAYASNFFYPRSLEFDISERDQKAGIPVFTETTSPGLNEFLVSAKGKEVENQLSQLLAGR